MALLVTVLTMPACGTGAQQSSAAGPAQPSRSQSPLSAVQREAISPDPYFDFGFMVQITPQGFHPQQLVSPCCQAITWRNLTSAPIAIVFDALQVDSGPIPPGGTFVFTPKNVESIAYHARDNPAMAGAVQVNQNSES